MSMNSPLTLSIRPTRPLPDLLPANRPGQRHNNKPGLIIEEAKRDTSQAGLNPAATGRLGVGGPGHLAIVPNRITLRVDGAAHRPDRRHPHHAARPAARAARQHQPEEGLRPRAVRRVHGAARRRPVAELPGARGRARRRRDRHRRRTGAGDGSCTRCSRRSSTTTPSSAATARRARSARRSACSTSSSAGWPSHVTADLAADPELDATPRSRNG